MVREFIPFDEDIIKKELRALPQAEAAKLVALIEHCETCTTTITSPAQIDRYSECVFRLRHIKSKNQGRLLFGKARNGQFVMLCILKKEGQKSAPKYPPISE